MKVIFSKKVYDQFDSNSRQRLLPIPCQCVDQGEAALDCDSCDGGGIVYEDKLSPEDSAAIEENLRRQGVPLGKTGTH